MNEIKRFDLFFISLLLIATLWFNPSNEDKFQKVGERCQPTYVRKH